MVGYEGAPHRPDIPVAGQRKRFPLGTLRRQKGFPRDVPGHTARDVRGNVLSSTCSTGRHDKETDRDDDEVFHPRRYPQVNSMHTRDTSSISAKGIGDGAPSRMAVRNAPRQAECPLSCRNRDEVDPKPLNPLACRRR